MTKLYWPFQFDTQEFENFQTFFTPNYTQDSNIDFSSQKKVFFVTPNFILNIYLAFLNHKDCIYKEEDF